MARDPKNHKHSPPHALPPARTSAHGNQTKENSEKEANPIHGTPGRGPACFSFCFHGLHIAPWFISLGLCLHTSVNMVPIALQHSGYKLLVGSTSLLPSHKRLGRNDWGPKERSSVGWKGVTSFTHVLTLINWFNKYLTEPGTVRGASISTEVKIKQKFLPSQGTPILVSFIHLISISRSWALNHLGVSTSGVTCEQPELLWTSIIITSAVFLVWLFWVFTMCQSLF